MLTTQQVIEKFRDRGFCLLPTTSQKLRDISTVAWFQQTIEVFVRSREGKTCDDAYVEEMDMELFGRLPCKDVQRRFVFHTTYKTPPSGIPPRPVLRDCKLES
eukprot:scaffold196915_cov51-Prasinocladus_malaysianus.AAC.3